MCSCPAGCRMGICHSCVVRLRSGRVRDLRTGRVHGDWDELIQTCVTAAAVPSRSMCRRTNCASARTSHRGRLQGDRP
ncbi:2Fe-2S iron-sulfur cluster-binding protein [Dactylosporangium cerinum]|uniref:2Fe-2S iron-sulfur cluster-binding protein n=1 Tax=Dactylosporangium cerinum TaxID=1434730 RepID=A0ABV9VSS1_9ACTN